MQDTEIGAWPALVSEGSDCFDCMRSGLARTEPPLRLVEAEPASAARPVAPLAHVLLEAGEPARECLARASEGRSIGPDSGALSTAGRRWVGISL